MAATVAQQSALNFNAMNVSHNQSPLQGAFPVSPMAQTPPSNNVSPTNQASHLYVKQLRQPRQPLYMPAALRPTELPGPAKDIPGQPKAPDTPPDSKHGSFDSAQSALSASSQSNGPTISFAPDDEIDRLRMSLSRAASEELEEEHGIVSGLPTTAHWKPDLSRTDCAVCHITFTWYFRRHHCRKCGDIVCGNHLTRTVPLDQNARFHSQGSSSKACDPCVDEWKIVKKLRHSRANSLADSQGSSNGTAKPAMTIPRHVKQDPDMRVGSLARSEGGMVWSTF